MKRFILGVFLCAVIGICAGVLLNADDVIQSGGAVARDVICAIAGCVDTVDIADNAVTTGKIANGTVAAVDLASGVAQVEFVLGRRFGFCQQAANADATFTCVGGANPTAVGAAGARSTVFGDRNGIVYTTTTSSGDDSGIRSSLNTAITTFPTPDSLYAPIFKASVSTASDITSQRIWVGLSSEDASGFSTSSTANTAEYVMVGYDTGGAATQANFQCCSSDGSNTGTSADCDDMGLAVQASTQYYVTIDCTNAPTSCTCTVNGTSTTITPFLTANNVGLFGHMTISTLTNAARSFYVHKYSLEQN